MLPVSLDEANIIKGIKTGAVDYIRKPISEEILIGKVTQLLEIQKNKNELELTKKQLEQNVTELNVVRNILNIKNEILEKLSTTDELTNLFNRRHFINLLT